MIRRMSAYAGMHANECEAQNLAKLWAVHTGEKYNHAMLNSKGDGSSNVTKDSRETESISKKNKVGWDEMENMRRALVMPQQVSVTHVPWCRSLSRDT